MFRKRRADDLQLVQDVTARRLNLYAVKTPFGVNYHPGLLYRSWDGGELWIMGPKTEFFARYWPGAWESIQLVTGPELDAVLNR